MPDVWPDVPMLGYFEFYYHTGQDVGFDPEFPDAEKQFPRIRAMNVVNLLALARPARPDADTVAAFRAIRNGRGRIRVLPEGAQLDLCRPDPRRERRLLDRQVRCRAARTSW